jgi:hypothetical protein
MEKRMLKPPMPNVPGMTDTLDFVKNLWGNMNVPGMTGPGLSTDELDKRISDLKAVEAWLNMNMTMLRGTIQAMEVQRGTIATLRAVSASMAQAMGQPGTGGAGGAMPFQNFFTPPGAAGAGKPPEGAPQGPQPTAQQAQPQPGAGAPPDSGLPPGAAAMPAAIAWWNLLQDQFKQAVSTAMSPEAMANATAMAQDAAARFSAAAKPPATPEASTGGGTDNASAQPGVATPKPRNGKPKTDKS